ncbi:uncharacterized protein C5L36_0B12290 [Pichia kudriavzevii]|uniref:LicD/FKTN/FKRP nucleotidyltransferase domain-containing protein n=1 Tax=Pichia kudriavzevii TaxID=4909 RepID=A0A2U9R3T5_PICKU|nr:uncharacterized protein C5L36_0B12290 [Pichia kudriavzevii]AWU76000.1 hypothetical protein C5L36_0B12290 [Pichia kudriavzevii]
MLILNKRLISLLAVLFSISLVIFISSSTSFHEWKEVKLLHHKLSPELQNKLNQQFSSVENEEVKQYKEYKEELAEKERIRKELEEKKKQEEEKKKQEEQKKKLEEEKKKQEEEERKKIEEQRLKEEEEKRKQEEEEKRKEEERKKKEEERRKEQEQLRKDAERRKTHFVNIKNFTYYDFDKTDYLTNEEIVDLLKHLKDDKEHDLTRYHHEIEFDKRITPASYLNEIYKTIGENNGVLSTDLKFKFSWADWLDFDSRLLPGKDFLERHNNQPIMGCDDYGELIGFPKNTPEKQEAVPACSGLSEEEFQSMDNNLYPRFKVTAPFDSKKISIPARIIHGSVYSLHELSPPERLVYVDGKTKTDIIVPIQDEKLKEKHVYNHSLVSKITNDETEDPEKLYLPPINKLMQKILETIKPSEINKNSSSIYEVSKINQDPHTLQEELSYQMSREEFDMPKNMDEIKQRLPNHEIENSLDRKLLEKIELEMNLYPRENYPKFFHECELDGTDGSHFDWRFFNVRSKTNSYKKTSTLNRIIRAWLRFTTTENIHTWLAHGTLLGYSFNEFMLPWDSDHDVQISTESMWRLAKNFNQSLIIDVTTDDELSSGYGQYFLDIGGNFFDRKNSNGANAIDARFIDIHTGMYIDITKLSKVHDVEKDLTRDFYNIHSEIKSEYFKMLKQYGITAEDIIKDGDLIGGNNNHYYRFSELENMKKCLFEGEYGYVQEVYPRILDREFPNRKTGWSFAGFTWRSKIGLWLKDELCTEGSNDRRGDSCMNHEYVKLLYDFIDKDGPKGGERRPIYPDWESVIALDHILDREGKHDK